MQFRPPRISLLAQVEDFDYSVAYCANDNVLVALRRLPGVIGSYTLRGVWYKEHYERQIVLSTAAGEARYSCEVIKF